MILFHANAEIHDTDCSGSVLFWRLHWLSKVTSTSPNPSKTAPQASFAKAAPVGCRRGYPRSSFSCRLEDIAVHVDLKVTPSVWQCCLAQESWLKALHSAPTHCLLALLLSGDVEPNTGAGIAEQLKEIFENHKASSCESIGVKLDSHISETDFYWW